MIRYDFSQIDFSSLSFPKKTKKFKEFINLYWDCMYEDAETLSSKLIGYEPQLADMRAQAAFFRSDFNECVNQIMIFYPFLVEWYSGNKRDDTKKMLEYALNKADKDVREEAISILTEMHKYFSKEQLEHRDYLHFKYIRTLIEHSTGNLEEFSNPHYIYTPPEKPKHLNEIIDTYIELHKKRIEKLQCDPMDDPATVREILFQIK